MNRLMIGCIMALIVVTSSPAWSHDKETCQSCCKEVYATCKEGKLADCDARYDKCLDKCLHGEKPMDPGKGKPVPKPEEPAKTLIPEVPPNPEQLQELKKK